MDSDLPAFPPGFLWGVATSSYQIEGAVHEEGRGESIWDRFSHTPGKIERGETGDIACDHFHRYAQDLDLMAELGVGAYRFSIAWPRLFPDGGTSLNQAGLDFYHRLVDGLLERGIAPVANLYHWDLPQGLQDRGGWQSRETVERFAHYAATAFRHLGDRVRLWVTHNEPWVVAFLGHHYGVHAPGITRLQAALDASHHLLLSHGTAVQAFRESGAGGQIGIVLNFHATYADGETDADQAAAVAADGCINRWFADPLLLGHYPEDTIELFQRAGAQIDRVQAGDLDVISRRIDFLGVNYYSPQRVRAGKGEFGFVVRREFDAEVPTSQMGWEIHPQGLTDVLVSLRERYEALPPLYVTENGVACPDEVTPDGAVHDSRRVEFLRDHIAATHSALDRGVDVRGYFVWSLLDNFEWSFGYRPRFGLVYVDYPTQRRIPKDSFGFYKRVTRK